MNRVSQVYPPSKALVTVEWSVSGPDRQSVRNSVVQKWLAEEPHTKYRYNAERCGNGQWLYLLRPTWLNKGFDFQVNLEGFRSLTRSNKGSTREMPSHDDVIDDLRGKVSQHPSVAGALFQAVADVYHCCEPGDAVARRRELEGVASGYATLDVLSVLKWLFIEQDVAYWLETGRDKLMSAIETKVFGIAP